MHEILIVEDEKIIRDSLSRLLRRNCYAVTAVGSVDEAKREDLPAFDLIVADIRLPGAVGTSLIALAHPARVLIMTSYSSVQSAVDAMKQGAADYNRFATECAANADSATKQLFEELVGDEERHFDQFDKQMDNIKRFGSNYLALQSFGPGDEVAPQGD